MKTKIVLLSSALMAVTAFGQMDTATTNATTSAEAAAPAKLYVDAGIDRDDVLPGKTYLKGYAGYTDPHAAARGGGRGGNNNNNATLGSRSPVTIAWSKESGPGDVTFENAQEGITTATFSQTGTYILKLSGKNAESALTSTLTVKVSEPPPKDRLDVVYTKNYSVDSPLWNDRTKSLIASWIPHCVDEINDLNLREGGINNFIQAGKRLARNKQIADDEKTLQPSQILRAEVLDYPGLVKKLTTQDTPAAALLWSKLSPETQAALTNAATSGQSEKILVDNLNKILVSTNLYTEESFKGVQLRGVTSQLVRPAPARGGGGGGGRGAGAAPTGERVAYANRLLLEDAFPGELAQVPEKHVGYPFSNAWVHQTVESMSLALMVDAKGDPEILKAQQKMRETLDQWIPIILAAQEPDGYLQTRFTLGTSGDRGPVYHWNANTRGEHEGYTAGYFIESAINHYTMTDGKDKRLYDAAKRLADCWVANLGPGKKAWYDGHQEVEQALVRFGRFVNDMEGNGRGDSYVALAKFLLDSRRGGSEYDQSHLPIVQQYEAVGHAVRASYTYSGMADVAAETHDTDYQSAVLSLWDNIVNKKYYVTGGIGSGETSEGFGPNYSLRNGAYCESCSSCGLIFFQYKMNIAYHDAKYADLYEDTMYNALLGSTDEDGKNFFYDNPLTGGNRTAWHTCPCCVGNIPRTLLMIPTWSYVKGNDGLYVNMYVGSTVNIEKVAGTDIKMVQKTDYPWSGQVSMTVNPKESKNFTVYLRAPNRATSDLYHETPTVDGILSLSVNGQSITPAIHNGYVAITRQWKAGDKIDLNLPMQVQRITADSKIAADRGLTCLRYGPLIYNVERADNANLNQAMGNTPLTTEWRPELLHGVMTIKGTWADGSPLIAIPNYARNNRLTQLAAAPAAEAATGTNQVAGAADGANNYNPAAGGRGGNSRGRSQVWFTAPAANAAPTPTP
jgi:DUF1680 family protein